MKKKGFIAAVVSQYKKGRKMVDDYQAGSAEREKKATDNFKKKTALLKQKTQYEKAKADYKKAKGGGRSMFGGNGGLGEPKPYNWSMGNNSGGMAGSWGVGMKEAPMKRKKRRKTAKKRGYKKKVVYYG